MTPSYTKPLTESYLRASLKEKAFESRAGTHQGLDAILRDLITPGDVELLEKGTTLTDRGKTEKDEWGMGKKSKKKNAAAKERDYTVRKQKPCYELKYLLYNQRVVNYLNLQITEGTAWGSLICYKISVDIHHNNDPYAPESFEWQVGNWGTGGKVQVLQLWTELTEAIARAAEEKHGEGFDSSEVAFWQTGILEQFTDLSVILVQPFRLSSSMFLQFCEKVLQGNKKCVMLVKRLWIWTGAAMISHLID